MVEFESCVLGLVRAPLRKRNAHVGLAQVTNTSAANCEMFAVSVVVAALVVSASAGSLIGFTADLNADNCSFSVLDAQSGQYRELASFPAWYAHNAGVNKPLTPDVSTHPLVPMPRWVWYVILLVNQAVD